MLLSYPFSKVTKEDVFHLPFSFLHITAYSSLILILGGEKVKILLYGKIRSGKSLASKFISVYLSEFKKESCEVLEFSLPVQECVNILYPESIGFKDRKKLIKVGQHMRKIDEDIWVNIIKNRIEKSKSDNILVVGARQRNEFKMLKKQGFIFVKISAPLNERKSRSLIVGDVNGEDLMFNPTEFEMDEVEPDVHIRNDESIEILEKKIYKMLKDLENDKKGA